MLVLPPGYSGKSVKMAKVSNQTPLPSLSWYVFVFLCTLRKFEKQFFAVSTSFYPQVKRTFTVPPLLVFFNKKDLINPFHKWKFKR
jgi:hypothetical protein